MNELAYSGLKLADMMDELHTQCVEELGERHIITDKVLAVWMHCSGFSIDIENAFAESDEH